MVVSVEHNSEFILYPYGGRLWSRRRENSGLPRIAGNSRSLPVAVLIRRTAGRSAYGAGTQNKLLFA